MRVTFDRGGSNSSTRTTELYYITGGSARGKKVSPKTWRLLRHFHDDRSSVLMVVTTDQPRSSASDDVLCPPGFLQNILLQLASVLYTSVFNRF